jgi:two-component system, LuxR family, response regulator FixJ
VAPSVSIVAVVDDDEAVRDSLKALLESYAYDVRDFTSPEEFLRAGHPAADGVVCLILDLHMPGMGGVAFLELLRRRGSRLPVIVITGRTDSLLRKRVESAGVVAMLEKPVDDEILLATLTRSIGGRTADIGPA